jgi:uncharacterized protein YwqG
VWSLLKTLLRRRWPLPPGQDKGAPAIIDLLKRAASPTILLKEGDRAIARLGGLPYLPSGVDWPLREGRPLHFLAQINLAGVRRVGGPDWLPDKGVLHVFYDAEHQPWGDTPTDHDGWAVLHTAKMSSAPSPPPAGLGTPFGERDLSGQGVDSYPTPERLGIGAAVDAESGDLVFDVLRSGFNNEIEHRIGGFPTPIQNDTMELDCQLASNGVTVGGPDSYRSKAAKVLAGDASDWRLLLQLESDYEAGMEWGDSGCLYVWIREQDARAGDFSRVWFVLQCC